MQLNLQPAEKIVADSDDGEILDVHSIFYTIQGEGPFAGTPAVFIRLAGCNLQCPKCDTSYTSGRAQVTIVTLAERCRILNSLPLVVITGGEPLRQNITPLVQALIDQGHSVQIETNGTCALSDELQQMVLVWDMPLYIVCSPKTPRIHSSIMRTACALKYVGQVDGLDTDGLPNEVLGYKHRVSRPDDNFLGTVYLQSADFQNEAKNLLNLNACIKSCMANGYTLCLQMHKIIHME